MVSALRYFAYGRNMGAQAMQRACPRHRFLGPAQLREHRLAFTRRSLRTGTGVADVVAARGESVWGALYELRGEADVAVLDEKEGNGWAYERRRARVLLGGEEHDAFLYAVVAPDAPHVEPSPEYVRALLEGGRERGLPHAYLDALRAPDEAS